MTDQSKFSISKSYAINFSILHERGLRRAPELLMTLSILQTHLIELTGAHKHYMTNGRKINNVRKDRQDKDRENDWPPVDLIKKVWMTSFPGTRSRRRMSRQGLGEGSGQQGFSILTHFNGWESAPLTLLV